MSNGNWRSHHPAIEQELSSSKKRMSTAGPTIRSVKLVVVGTPPDRDLHIYTIRRIGLDVCLPHMQEMELWERPAY